MAAALRLLPIQVAIAGAAAVMGLVGLLSPKEVYEPIDWRVVVLLGAMIPLGGAIEDTGVAARVAGALVAVSGDLPTWTSVAAVLLIAMLLSDIVNNTAAAVLVTPIALGVASRLSPSPDPSHGGCGRGIGGVPDIDRPPVEPAGDGLGWLPVHRLLAARFAPRGCDPDSRRTADPAHLATLMPLGASPAGVRGAGFASGLRWRGSLAGAGPKAARRA